MKFIKGRIIVFMAIVFFIIIAFCSEGNILINEVGNESIFNNSRESSELSELKNLEDPSVGLKLSGLKMKDKATDKSNIIDVTDFGVVGDGVANDTPHIQAALDYCESLGGGKVIFPANKVLRISKAGYRSIWTWNTKIKYKRAYALLIPSNTVIDFNGCTLLADKSNNDTINIIENKNASIDLQKDNNIEIRNVILNQNVNIDKFNGNDLDSCAACLQNVDGLVLDNVEILNSYSYGLRIIKAINVELKNKVHIKNCIGCNMRIGWDIFTVEHVFINQLICENSSNRLYNKEHRYTPGNTLYINSGINIYFGEYKQLTNDPKAYVGSVNISNNAENIYFNNILSYDTGFKIQDYTTDGKGQPTNININNLITEGIKSTPIFYLMGDKVKIRKMSCKNLGAFWVNNGKYTELGYVYLDNCFFVVKGALPKKLLVYNLNMLNSHAAFQANGGSDTVFINQANVKWDTGVYKDSYLKLLDIQCEFMKINTITYKLDGSFANGSQKGDVLSRSSSNKVLSVGHVINLNISNK
ncbi:hypothetical protein [Clostridium manihotivorum]|uniref:Pectate lyase superfamily protein domain-containing protein n=1 Tax=Clostridium manihotivorum TaxID=2320868 RepID=A0A3R5TJ59_9CLOT|nr:hypothetical protein [Clostridium manihotivorum]QAA34728.1 hypothetical protein C1I91_25550 [Clostridium manihotivorum]